mmetsp:Transcript_44754/g.133690  ORF Transcript_44754/g.133690 Transcript_44754/m.133690 type:complete len:88 (-) Transcript_44754:257-520(-)
MQNLASFSTQIGKHRFSYQLQMHHLKPSKEMCSSAARLQAWAGASAMHVQYSMCDAALSTCSSTGILDSLSTAIKSQLCNIAPVAGI